MHLLLYYPSDMDRVLVETIMLFRYCLYFSYFYGDGINRLNTILPVIRPESYSKFCSLVTM